MIKIMKKMEDSAKFLLQKSFTVLKFNMRKLMSRLLLKRKNLRDVEVWKALSIIEVGFIEFGKLLAKWLQKSAATFEVQNCEETYEFKKYKWMLVQYK